MTGNLSSLVTLTSVLQSGQPMVLSSSSAEESTTVSHPGEGADEDSAFMETLNLLQEELQGVRVRGAHNGAVQFGVLGDYKVSSGETSFSCPSHSRQTRSISRE